MVRCRKAKGSIGRPSCSGFSPAPRCCWYFDINLLVASALGRSRRSGNMGRLQRRGQLEDWQVGRQKDQRYAAEQREQPKYAGGDRAVGLAGPKQADQDHESRGEPDGGVEAAGQPREQRQVAAGQAEGGEGVGELRKNSHADQGDGDGGDDAGDQAGEQPDDSP